MCLNIDKDVKLHFLAPESHIRTHAYHLWENAGKPNECFWYKAEAECHYILGYKIVIQSRSSIFSPIQRYLWQAEWNVSNFNEHSIIESVGFSFVFEGIHVYLDPWIATELSKLVPHAIVMCVHCYEDDFIAAGWSNSPWQSTNIFLNKIPSAVFKKVFVPKTEFLNVSHR